MITKSWPPLSGADIRIVFARWTMAGLLCAMLGGVRVVGNSHFPLPDGFCGICVVYVHSRRAGSGCLI